MDVTQLSLNLALAAMPTWSGTVDYEIDSTILIDPRLSKSTEAFSNGTIWITGSNPSLILVNVDTYSGGRILLSTAIPIELDPEDPDPPTSVKINYIISPIPFATLLHVINVALQNEKEMYIEDIDVNSDAPSYYAITASDIRRVEIVSEDGESKIHYNWRETPGELRFFGNVPSTEGSTIRCWFPRTPTIKSTAADILPDNLRLEVFLLNCQQLLQRMVIQKVGKDGVSNYDLMNDIKGELERKHMRGITHASSIMNYDPRFRV